MTTPAFIDGKIQPSHDCPWKNKCEFDRCGECDRRNFFTIAYSCGHARLFAAMSVAQDLKFGKA